MSKKKNRSFARRPKEGTILYSRRQAKIYDYWDKFQQFRYKIWEKEYDPKSTSYYTKQKIAHLRSIYGESGKVEIYDIHNFEQFKRIFESNFYKYQKTKLNRYKYAYKQIINLYRIIDTNEASAMAQAIYKRVIDNKVNTMDGRDQSKELLFNTELQNWYQGLVGIDSVAELADLIYNRDKGFTELMEIKNRYFPDDSNIEAFYC